MKTGTPQFDALLRALVSKEADILRAHRLGIPLEDCICAVVRKTLRNLDVNPEQLELGFNPPSRSSKPR